MLHKKKAGSMILNAILLVCTLLSCSKESLVHSGNNFTYTVTYNSGGGKFANGESSLKVNYRALSFAYAPDEEPKKAGKYFQYWYSTDSLTTFSFSTQRIGFNLELHAKWDSNPRVLVLFDPVSQSVTGVDPNYTNNIVIDIPEMIRGVAVLKIANNAFNGKTNISQVTLPGSLTDIGNSAFNGCTNLSKCDLPAGLKTLGTNSFYGTAITNLVIPDGVTAIPTSCFQLCSQLTQATLPANLTTIGQNSFNASGLTSIVIPSKVTSLGASCFQNCLVLASVNVTEPSLLQTWSSGCMAGCTSLTSLTIPKPSNNSQVTIDVNAFLGNSNLSIVKIYPSSPLVKLNNVSAFSNCSPSLQILVPTAALSNYKAAASWTSISTKLIGY